jgi:hypothetical protein
VNPKRGCATNRKVPSPTAKTAVRECWALLSQFVGSSVREHLRGPHAAVLPSDQRCELDDVVRAYFADQLSSSRILPSSKSPRWTAWIRTSWPLAQRFVSPV